MIIDSFNIKGARSRLKIKCISKIINDGNADIFLIQETKLSDIDLVVSRRFWHKAIIGWSFSSSKGRSGGC